MKVRFILVCADLGSTSATSAAVNCHRILDLRHRQYETYTLLHALQPCTPPQGLMPGNAMNDGKETLLVVLDILKEVLGDQSWLSQAMTAHRTCYRRCLECKGQNQDAAFVPWPIAADGGANGTSGGRGTLSLK
jgi:hypothetical protein